jgi:hypothetical protein
MNSDYNTIENFNSLVEKGDIVECPNCLKYNAYAFMDVNIDSNTGIRFINADGFADGGEAYTDDEILTNWPDVYGISSCSGFEWECGNCHTHWMDRNSPINHPAYTHEDDY